MKIRYQLSRMCVGVRLAYGLFVIKHYIIIYQVLSIACYLLFQNVTKTVEEAKPKPPTIQELKEMISNYNSKVNNCLLMKLVGIAILDISYFCCDGS